MAFLYLVVALTLQSPSVGVAVVGVVSDDSTGLPLHGARVELAGGGAWSVTDSLGSYTLPAEPHAGPQLLRVSRLGYEPRVLHVLMPSLGMLRVDVMLRPRPALMPLVLISVVPLASHSAAAQRFPDAVRRWSSAQLESHPLLAEPDALAAFAADPDVSIAQETPTALHVRGGSSDQTRFLIDGVPFYNPAHSAGAFAALNPDVLDGVALHTGARTAAFGGTLAATVEAHTRIADSSHFHMRGGVTPTAVRLTVDGPLVPGLADVVISARRGGPSLFGGRPDRTRVTAAFNDWLFKTGTRVGSGALTLLATAATDRTAFTARAESQAGDGARHTFDWGAATYAALWRTPFASRSSLNVAVWHAAFDADATWLDVGRFDMSSTRQSLGLNSALVRQRDGGHTRIGFELLHDRVGFSVRDAAAGTPMIDASLRGGVASSVTLFAEHETQLSTRWQMRPGVRAVALLSGQLFFEPRLSASFRLSPDLTIAGGLARSHQSLQSLRNAESPATAVFGPDLPLLSRGSIPVARSDEASLALTAITGDNTRLTLDAYRRRLTGLAVAQPQSAIPFAMRHPAIGRGDAWGVGGSIESNHDRSTARLSAGLGSTRITLRDAPDSAATFQPGFFSTRSVTAAAAYRLTNATSIRSAVIARWGRRTTLYDGVMDWEGCDALDGGCELAGTPGRALGRISSAQLPPYIRWDAGVRRVFTTTFAGRDVQFEAHATIRNLLDRRNVWGFSSEGERGARRLMLRPLSLLTAGLDFRY